MGYPSFNTDLSKLQGEDLDRLQSQLVREKTVRYVMAETGEDRQTVVDLMGAAVSMGQESVLVLTDGEPTTLADALQRYVDDLASLTNDDPNDEEAGAYAIVLDALTALLEYPWPGAGANVHDPVSPALTSAIDASPPRG